MNIDRTTIETDAVIGRNSHDFIFRCVHTLSIYIHLGHRLRRRSAIHINVIVEYPEQLSLLHIMANTNLCSKYVFYMRILKLI